MCLRRALSLAVLGVALAGCQNPYIDNPVMTEKFILSMGWVKPRAIVPEPVYCYRTLAKVDCYEDPQPEFAHRIVNFYGPFHP